MFLEALLWQRFVTGFPVRLWSGEAGKRGKRLLNKKKSIANTIFLVLIFALTLYSVFHGEDLPAVLRTIGEVNPWYLIPGTAGVILFIWGNRSLSGICSVHWIFMKRNGRVFYIPV